MSDTLTAPSTDALEIILSKIERLWRKANDTAATEPERQAFEAKALSLIERHRIDRALLVLDEKDILEDHSYGNVAGRYATVEIQLLSSIAHAYSCRTWWRSYSSSKDVYVFGYNSDAAKVIRLTKLLLADAQAQAARLTSGSPAQTFSVRRGFILGYAAAIATRLKEAARIARDDATVQYAGAATAHTPGTATTVDSAVLVLVERSKEVDQAMKQRKFRKSSPIAAGNARGYSRGREAGSKADLSGGGRRLGGGTKAIGR